MNGKMYWVLRKTIQNIVFRVKKVIYRLIDDYNVSEEAINVELDEDNIFKKMTITVPLKTYAKIEEDKLFENYFKK